VTQIYHTWHLSLHDGRQLFHKTSWKLEYKRDYTRFLLWLVLHFFGLLVDVYFGLKLMDIQFTDGQIIIFMDRRQQKQKWRVVQTNNWLLCWIQWVISWDDALQLKHYSLSLTPYLSRNIRYLPGTNPRQPGIRGVINWISEQDPI